MAETFDDLIKVKEIAKVFTNRNASLHTLKQHCSMINDLDKDNPKQCRFSMLEKDAEAEMVTLKSATKTLDALLLKSNYSIGSDESYINDQKQYRNAMFECVDAMEEYTKIILDKELISGTVDTKPYPGAINDFTNTLAQILKKSK